MSSVLCRWPQAQHRYNIDAAGISLLSDVTDRGKQRSISVGARHRMQSITDPGQTLGHYHLVGVERCEIAAFLPATFPRVCNGSRLVDIEVAHLTRDSRARAAPIQSRLV